MTEKEYFESLSQSYVDELLRLNKCDEPAFAKRWKKKPATLINDITIVRKAIEKGWLIRVADDSAKRKN